MFKHLAMLLTAFMLSTAAQAQTATDKLNWNPDGTLSINSVLIAPNRCYTAGPAVEGVPLGERPILNAIPVIYPVLTNQTLGISCVQVLTPLKYSITVKVPLALGINSIVVYTVIDKKSVSVRTLALPPRTLTFM